MAPVTVGVLSVKVLPEHIGPLLLAVGVAGIGLTVAEVEPAADVQPLDVTVRLYVPVAAVVAFDIVGFCKEELKLLGPVQL